MKKKFLPIFLALTSILVSANLHAATLMMSGWDISRALNGDGTVWVNELRTYNVLLTLAVLVGCLSSFLLTRMILSNDLPSAS